MREPYAVMTRAMVLLKAAGLMIPAATKGEKLRLLDLWVQRYGAVDGAVFMAAVRALTAGQYFPRFCDMDAAVRVELRCRERLEAERTGQEQEQTVNGDREANRQRVQALIDRLAKGRSK